MPLCDSDTLVEYHINTSDPNDRNLYHDVHGSLGLSLVSTVRVILDDALAWEWVWTTHRKGHTSASQIETVAATKVEIQDLQRKARWVAQQCTVCRWQV